MADNRYFTGNAKESVCINSSRIYDCCKDKDCFEDVRVYLTRVGQSVADRAINIKARSAEVIWVYIDVEEVPFNDGFYTVDLKFFFRVTFDAFCGVGRPTQIEGLAVADKKVILYGSEGNVRVFSSDMTADGYDVQNLSTRSLPTANVQVAKPIALAVSVKDKQQYLDTNVLNYNIPESILDYIGGNISEDGEKIVLATLGVFSIVQLMRNVQMLIPSYDFCIPEKRCENSTDSPCEMFSRLDFPTDEFFPPNVTDQNGGDGGCGCGCETEE